MTVSITDIQHNNALHFAVSHNDDCCNLLIVMLSAMLSVFIFSVFMVNVALLSVLEPGPHLVLELTLCFTLLGHIYTSDLVLAFSLSDVISLGKKYLFKSPSPAAVLFCRLCKCYFTECSVYSIIWPL
jgi:hypothetical protein